MKNNYIRKIILIIGIILLIFLFASNTLFSTDIKNNISEKTIISLNNPFYMAIIFIAVLLIYKLLDIFDEKVPNKIKKIIYLVMIIIFALVQVIWIVYRNLYPYGDQLGVYKVANHIYYGNTKALMFNEYLQYCPQQINLSVIWGLIFKIFNSTNVKLLQYFNVIANTISLITFVNIAKELNKKYEVNLSRLVFLFTTFIPIILLSSFPYGDIPGFCFSLLSLLFIVRYTNSEKILNLFISALFISIACIIRINYIIFFIAIMIYMFVNTIYTYKSNTIIRKILLLLLYIIIAVLPSQIMKTTFQNKYSLNKNNAIPTTAYMYVAMTEGSRGNGWYNDNVFYALENPGNCSEYYNNKIKDRIKEFSDNPIYFLKFYSKKEVSMWDENTFQSIWYNESFNISKKEYKDYDKDKQLLKYYDYIYFWQKILVIMISLLSICYLIKNYKKIDNNIILLLLVFIGGFSFHTLWEAKSRYILPYMIILILISSLKIKNNGKKRLCSD